MSRRIAAPRRGGFPVFLVLFFSGAVAIACYVGYQVYDAHQARRNAEAVFARHDAAMRKWDVSMDIASRAPRLALAGPIRDLADIEESVRANTGTACVIEATKKLAWSMQMPRDALMEFMANNPGADLIIESALRMALSARGDYARLRKACLEDPRG